MATSVYFNNFGSSQEQNLIEDLIVESIKIYGHDLYYLPRVTSDYDPLYAESPLSEFNTSYFVEMYIKNVDGFDGDGDFISKFGLEIRDRVTFTITRRIFNDEVGSTALLTRPREGDLIFFPLNNKVFEIKFVEHESIFYQLGALQTYDIICELFEYGSERFNTGINIIDDLFTNNYATGLNYSSSMTDSGIKTEAVNEYDEYFITYEDGYKIVNESFSESIGDSDTIQLESDTFTDFSEMDPFAEGAY